MGRRNPTFDSNVSTFGVSSEHSPFASHRCNCNRLRGITVSGRIFFSSSTLIAFKQSKLGEKYTFIKRHRSLLCSELNGVCLWYFYDLFAFTLHIPNKIL